MILRLQISFPLPKAYNSTPSNWRVIRAVLVSFRSAERSLRRELTLERGGGEKTTTPYLIVTKKCWNVAGVWLQWWFVASVPGRGFSWRLMQSWWQKANVWGLPRLHHYCICGAVACVGKRYMAVSSIDLYKKKVPLLWASIYGMIWFYYSYHTSDQWCHLAHFRTRKITSELFAKNPTCNFWVSAV